MKLVSVVEGDQGPLAAGAGGPVVPDPGGHILVSSAHVRLRSSPSDSVQRRRSRTSATLGELGSPIALTS